MITDPAKRTPWWVIDTSFEEDNPAGDNDGFAPLLSHQLRQWTLRDAVRSRTEDMKWWQIDSLDVPLPKSPEQLYDNLRQFIVERYPLRRRGELAPSISGDINETELTIALVGDVRDPRSRAYLHCLGKLIRMEALELLDPIDLNLRAFICLPHNSHQDEPDEIALFLSELHTMMLEPVGDRAFDWIIFIQDKNSSKVQPYGYGQLSSAQLAELMSQTLFHSMISEGLALRTIAQNFSTSYLSVGAVSLYYNWDHHRQKLAEAASRILIDKFALSREPPFIDELEADLAITALKLHFKNHSLLSQLFSITHTLFNETIIASEFISKAERPTDLRDTTSGSEDSFKESEILYKEAVRIAGESINKGRTMLWQGGQAVDAKELTIVKALRGIFAGKYGNGDARVIEQAIMVIDRLKEYLVEEREDLYRLNNDYSQFVENLLKPFEPEAEPTVSEDDRQEPNPGQTLPALILYQVWEWLLSIPLWGKVLSGVLAALGSGYLLYRRRKMRAVQKDKDVEFKPLGVTKYEKLKFEDQLRSNLKETLTDIYYQALTLVQTLELYIVSIRRSMDVPTPVPTPVYTSTTFCRSVFEDLVVPGRRSFGRLISNGDFTPRIKFEQGVMRFEDLGNTELQPLVNQFAENPTVIKSLAPTSIEESDLKSLSLKSASAVSKSVYDFAYDLYGRSVPFDMNDALQQIRDLGTHDNFLSYAIRAAAPPVVLSPTVPIDQMPHHIEVKYHDPELLSSILRNGLNGRNVTNFEKVENSELLSLGIFQPIPLSVNAEFSSLDSINTIGAMRVPWSFAERISPSLVFTLATLTRATESNVTLVNVIDGRALSLASSIVDNIADFKRHIEDSGMPLRDWPRTDSELEVMRRQAEQYVAQQMGHEIKWGRINRALWEAIGKSKDKSIMLADVDRIATTTAAHSDEVLALLSALSSPGAGLIQMGYFAREEDVRVSREEVVKHLRAWWRDQTMSHDEWQAWAGNVMVKWSVIFKEQG